MARKLPKFLRKDKRKYPILKDIEGKSARARCFEAFDKGDRPVKVAKDINISFKTVCHYHWQWKKLPKNFTEEYQELKILLNKRPKVKESIIKILSEKHGMPEYKIKLLLESPWGLNQIKSGKLLQQIKREGNIRNSKTFKLHMLLINGYETKGLTLDDIIDALDKLVEEKQIQKDPPNPTPKD